MAQVLNEFGDEDVSDVAQVMKEFGDEDVSDVAQVLKEFGDEDVSDVVLVRKSSEVCLRGHLRGSGHPVTVKLLTSTAESDWLVQVKDTVTRGRVSSERVLLPLGVYKSRSLLGLVWDWMAEGSLHSLLYETHLYPDLHMVLQLQILLDVAEGLNHLHAVPLPHGALKATNVLVDQLYRAKLCDWGQQTVVDMRTPVSPAGGPCFRDLVYVSPEVIRGGAASVKADIYSFGVLIWEVVNRRRPCEVMDHLQTLLMFAQGGAESGLDVQLLPLETPQSQALIQLMIRCWSSDPTKRPLAEECVEELRKAVATYDSDALDAAVCKLKASKERAQFGCKNTTTWELPIELNNLEGYSGCRSSKHLTSKIIPKNVPCWNKPAPRIPKSDETSSRGSPAFTSTARPSSVSGCCKDGANNLFLSKRTSSISCNSSGYRQCGAVCGVTRTQAPPNTPCGSPTAVIQAPLQHPSLINQACPGSSGWSCCRLLQERREVIVHCMTEGRLNNLLDVLRARQAVTRETYELITAALTLTARTRCLLDVCSCLGENVALLVASTLGLVSIQASHGPGRAQVTSKGQAG